MMCDGWQGAVISKLAQVAQMICVLLWTPSLTTDLTTVVCVSLSFPALKDFGWPPARSAGPLAV